MELHIVRYSGLTDITARWEKGTIGLIQGHGGAGKTTFLGAIAFALYDCAYGRSQSHFSRKGCDVTLVVEGVPILGGEEYGEEYNTMDVERMNPSARRELGRITIRRTTRPNVLYVSLGGVEYVDGPAQGVIDRIFGDLELFELCGYPKQTELPHLLQRAAIQERVDALNHLIFQSSHVPPSDYISKVKAVMKELTAKYGVEHEVYEGLVSAYSRRLEVRPVIRIDDVVEELAERLSAESDALKEYYREEAAYNSLIGRLREAEATKRRDVERYETLTRELEALPPIPDLPTQETLDTVVATRSELTPQLEEAKQVVTDATQSLALLSRERELKQGERRKLEARSKDVERARVQAAEKQKRDYANALATYNREVERYRKQEEAAATLADMTGRVKGMMEGRGADGSVVATMMASLLVSASTGGDTASSTSGTTVTKRPVKVAGGPVKVVKTTSVTSTPTGTFSQSDYTALQRSWDAYNEGITLAAKMHVPYDKVAIGEAITRYEAHIVTLGRMERYKEWKRTKDALDAEVPDRDKIDDLLREARDKLQGLKMASKLLTCPECKVPLRLDPGNAKTHPSLCSVASSVSPDEARQSLSQCEGEVKRLESLVKRKMALEGILAPLEASKTNMEPTMDDTLSGVNETMAKDKISSLRRIVVVEKPTMPLEEAKLILSAQQQRSIVIAMGSVMAPTPPEEPAVEIDKSTDTGTVDTSIVSEMAALDGEITTLAGAEKDASEKLTAAKAKLSTLEGVARELDDRIRVVTRELTAKVTEMKRREAMESDLTARRAAMEASIEAVEQITMAIKEMVERGVPDAVGACERRIVDLREAIDQRKYQDEMTEERDRLSERLEAVESLREDVLAATRLYRVAVNVQYAALTSVVAKINRLLLACSDHVFANPPITVKLVLHRVSKQSGGIVKTKHEVGIETYQRGVLFDYKRDLSVSQRKRTAIALIIALNAIHPVPIILLDELMTNMTEPEREKCIDAVRHFLLRDGRGDGWMEQDEGNESGISHGRIVLCAEHHASETNYDSVVVIDSEVHATV